MRIKFFVPLFVLLVLILPLNFAHADSSFLGKINSFFPKKEVNTNIILDQNELTNLIKPSIVRIVQKTTGSINVVGVFDVSLKDFKITRLPDRKDPVVVPVGENLIFTGTGFIFSSDGYIMTNSHVVSSEEVVNSIVDVGVQTVLKGALYALNNEEYKVFEEKMKTAEGKKQLEDFTKEIKKEMLKSITLNLETKIVVADPNSDLKDLDIEKVLEKGFVAKIISVNNTTDEDQKDVAIIKIDKTNLPTLSFADSFKDKLNVGQKLYVFGFPSSANFSTKIDANFFEPTLSSGAVSSFKDSIKGDFKVIQADMKASSGSSGSPVLNERGEVVGIMTFISGNAAESVGDSFSFAVPLSVIEEVLGKSSVEIIPGNLYGNFIKGILSMAQNHYSKAKEEFTVAKDFNVDFGSNLFIDEYLTKSEEAKAQGKSIDNEWQQFLENIKPHYSLIVIITVSGLVLLILVFFLIFLLGKLRKDEKKIQELTNHDLQQDLKTTQNTVPAQAVVSAINVMPVSPQSSLPSSVPTSAGAPSARVNDIVEFIKKSVSAGQTDGLIFRGLKGGGYSEQEIQEAFMIFRHLK